MGACYRSYAPFRRIIMAATVTLYSSSIGQKIVSAATGLFLCAFLVVHISGNLLLYKNDGGRAFNEYAAANMSSILVRSLEIVLFAGFLIHICWGIRVWLYNRRARRLGYAVYHPSENSSLPSRIMILSGLVVLFFLVVHIKSFWFPMRFTGGREVSDFLLVTTAFKNPLYDALYLVCLVLLGCHLHQGFQSAFQTFGLRSFWRYPIEWLAVIFWLLIPLGFASMPLYFLFSNGAG
jgi:succinate dehydrogenase / fumarate reductase cytochrome b subunit